MNREVNAPMSSPDHEDHEHEDITHKGEKLAPMRNTRDAQRHMGTLEDNMTPIAPLVVGSANLSSENNDDHRSHRELSPG